MNIRNKKLPLTLLLSCLTPGVATAEAQLFGKANLSVASLEDDVGSSASVASHSSRVGIKGNIESNGSLEVGYRFVWQIDMADEAKSSNDHLKSREQYISLKDSWGEVRIGRRDTPYKKAGKKSVEFFSDSYADWNNIITKSHDKRADSSVSYYKTLGPAKLSLMYAGGEDTPTNDNAGDIVSVAADIKFGNFNFALAYQDIAEIPDPVPANVVPATKAAKVVVGFKLGDTSVGVVAEEIDEEGALEKTNAMLSLKHKINDNNTIKATYGVVEKTTPGIEDPTMTAFGIDHKLNDSVTAFLYWAEGSDGGLDADARLVGEATVIAAGVIVKF
ncbi:MAG: porin [Gammaproteobacteria bacterium]|nr:porin [Gammaproteobacteria bacterium]